VSEGLTRPLTLIAAPAGFGKTTLIGQWRAGPGHQFPLAWLSLDDDDNDPTRFLTYLIATLETLRVGIGERALALVQSLQPQPPKVILTILVNDLTAIPTSFAVVLDDYHAINTQAIHDAIAFLLDHLPPQMHLIITSRADPPLALARLRASNLLTEIRADDLRFTREEVATFLNQIMGQDLSAADVAVLADRTEGWIAGLQLAALSMGGQTDATNFIAAFAGSHQYVVDYLTEEAVRLLPESVQSFLLHTSILDRMCAPLCDAVTGQSGSQAVLEELERMNMFTIRLDDAHRWYRYHHLFAEMLRNRLRRAHSDRVLELHRRASAWYEGQELRAEAVRHALAGRDFERAAHLVEESAKTTFWMRGEVATLRGWLEALPDVLVSKHPRLSLLYAWTLLLSGQSAAVEPLLQETERRLERSLQRATEASAVNSPVMSRSSLAEIRGCRGEMAAIRARVARVNDDLPRSIALCHMALEYLPPQDLSVRGLVALNLGIACRHSGDVVAAAEALAEASAISEPAGNLFATLVALGQLANLEAEQGRLRQAASTYRCALAKAVGRGEKPVPAAAWAAVGLGELMRQWNELDAASHHMLEGQELATQWGETQTGWRGPI
jgi:LuxR family maltose regulon positive regulatory protein